MKKKLGEFILQDFVFSLISSLILVCAISLDSFAASFAYGTNKIKIPVVSIIIISGISATFLTFSLLLGSVISPLLPKTLPNIISFVMLFSIGLIKLFDAVIKSKIDNGKNVNRKMSFSMFNLKFILNVYADPKLADSDMSKFLSPVEAMSLATALSLDGIAVGFGAALSHNDIFVIIVLAVILGVSALILGGKLGQKAGEKLPINLSWVGGVMIMVLAIFKL